MAKILPFPKQLQQQQPVFEVDHCAGCQEGIEGDYWEVTIPLADGRQKHIALCDDCNEEVIKHGVVL